MNVLFVAVEMSPVAKVGGLADVIGALPRELRRLGVDARVVLPCYRMVADNPDIQIKPLFEFEVQVGPGWSKKAELSSAEILGVPVWLIGTDEWFIESVDSSTLYQPGGDMHLFFSQAVMQMLDLLQWAPEVLHCHDWHTGLLPVLMRTRPDFSDIASIFTIHNFAYQGEFGIEVLDRVGLPRSMFNSHELEAYGSVNFLKSGCVFADRVNTVSRSYAAEIQTSTYGCGLEGLMRHLANSGRLRGILNGIDTEVFDPRTDPSLPTNFSISDPSGKKVCKAVLREELGLPKNSMPVAGIVSRLSGQKGLDLVAEACEFIAEDEYQLVVQGLGDETISSQFRVLQERFPDHLRLVEKFDARLAQHVYGGSDFFFMPSRFEPCGLGQLIAMRYGTVPVVRATGGLKDTVEDSKTGFSFTEPTGREFRRAVHRALALYKEKALWSAMRRRIMSLNWGWDKSALEYISMYEDSLESRVAQIA